MYTIQYVVLHGSVGCRFDKITLDYGQVAEVTFWEFPFKKNIGSYELDQIRIGRIAKYSCM